MNIISTHKRLKVDIMGREKNTRVKRGMKRVMAIVEENGRSVTRHLDVAE